MAVSSEVYAKTIGNPFHFRTKPNLNLTITSAVRFWQVRARVWACSAHGHRRSTAFARFSTHETFSASRMWYIFSHGKDYNTGYTLQHLRWLFLSGFCFHFDVWSACFFFISKWYYRLRTSALWSVVNCSYGFLYHKLRLTVVRLL